MLVLLDHTDRRPFSFSGERKEFKLNNHEIKKDAGYLEELAGRLWRERIHTLPVQNGLLTVTLDDRPVGAVGENGDIYQRRSDLDTPEAKDLYFRVQDISREVSEYMKEMERAPVLEVEGLNEPYKLLAEYKDVVLCGRQYGNGYGVQFVTWSRNFDRTGVTLGHYFGNCYQEAKQDFAVRSGLVQSERLFSEAQLAEIYRSVQQTLYTDLELTRTQEKTLQSVSDQITELLPGIAERQIQQQSMEQSM